MKKTTLVILLCIYSVVSFGQKGVEGKWAFKKMTFYGREISFDNSETEKEKLLLSWMEMSGADIEDKDLKKGYMEQKQKIYKIAKNIFGSNIIFENLETDEKSYGSAELKSIEQAEDENQFEMTTKNVEFDYQEKNYLLMTVIESKKFVNYDELKIILKGNTLEIINLDDGWEDEGVIKITYERK